MLKMILTVPVGYEVEKFCETALAVARNGNADDTMCAHKDFNDGYGLEPEYIYPSARFRTVMELDKSMYAIDANLVDIGMMEIFNDLQLLGCPVEIHFENDGDSYTSPQSRKEFAELYRLRSSADLTIYDDTLDHLYNETAHTPNKLLTTTPA